MRLPEENGSDSGHGDGEYLFDPLENVTLACIKNARKLSAIREVENTR
jgi:hypothetical protein